MSPLLWVTLGWSYLNCLLPVLGGARAVTEGAAGTPSQGSQLGGEFARLGRETGCGGSWGGPPLAVE